VSGGDHRWFRRSTGKKRPVARDDDYDNNNNNYNNKLDFVQVECKEGAATTL